MSKMRAVQVSAAHGAFEIVEREIPSPRPGTVLIKVQACGICHSDSITKDGIMPVQYPRVPGHEVVGVIDALGDNVRGWNKSQRVGVGWHGGNCGYCENCRRGDFFACQTETIITGVVRISSSLFTSSIDKGTNDINHTVMLSILISMIGTARTRLNMNSRLS